MGHTVYIKGMDKELWIAQAICFEYSDALYLSEQYKNLGYDVKIKKEYRKTLG